MKLREFNELVVGNEVENAMTNGKGTVSKIEELRAGRVVSVKWGASHPPHGGMEFSYPVHSTAWMHWNTVASDCMCGRGASGDKPCPGPDGKPACFVSDASGGQP